MKPTLPGVFQKIFRSKMTLFGLVSIILAACVTVNVNFPESAVQKATDDYVQELYRAKEKGRAPSPATNPSPSPVHVSLSLLSEAYATDRTGGGFQLNSDKAKKIQQRQASRLEEVLSYKRSGNLGENKDGMLVIKQQEKTKKLLLKKLENLVKDENADREELYNEVLRSNGLPRTSIKDIQASFARSFQNASPAGTWIEDSDGKWNQKQ